MADDPVDLERIRESTLGDEEFMLELIGVFLNDSTKQLRVLRAAVEGREAQGAASTAHRLKGSSGNLGADSLSALCRRLEESGREQRLEEMPVLLEDIEREFARVKEYLVAVRQSAADQGFPCT